jgi:hypothetical protein
LLTLAGAKYVPKTAQDASANGNRKDSNNNEHDPNVIVVEYPKANESMSSNEAAKPPGPGTFTNLAEEGQVEEVSHQSERKGDETQKQDSLRTEAPRAQDSYGVQHQRGKTALLNEEYGNEGRVAEEGQGQKQSLAENVVAQSLYTSTHPTVDKSLDNVRRVNPKSEDSHEPQPPQGASKDEIGLESGDFTAGFDSVGGMQELQTDSSDTPVMSPTQYTAASEQGRHRRSEHLTCRISEPQQRTTNTDAKGASLNSERGLINHNEDAIEGNWQKSGVRLSGLSPIPQKGQRHTKSRRGCRNCKQRRIKCNEGIPCKTRRTERHYSQANHFLPGAHCTRAGLHCDCYDTIISVTPLGSRLDFSKVRQWRAQCEDTHGDCCNNRYTDALAQQLDCLLLVDVISGYLVELPTSTKFIALSYVWGNVEMLKSEKSNISQLKEPGALFREPFKSALPDTIRDAMHVVKALGEQYLWVDCLSILQDSAKEDIETMLRAMARIYTSAEFTIVAAQGDNANFGLRGAGGPSQERNPIDGRPDSCNDRGNGFPWHSRWASRGWTFQETLFSRRLLIFDKFVSWICGRHIRLEGEVTPPLAAVPITVWPPERPHLGIPMGMMSLIPNKPSLGRWGMIIENFSSRNLTFEHDTSRALAGATEVMVGAFPGGVFHGLPLFYLDIALLWQPRSTVERRPGEPSWSWKGWKGRVDCLSSWQVFFPGVYRKSGLSTDWVVRAPLRPLAKWEFGLDRPLGESQSITNGFANRFYHYQSMRTDPNCMLPPGWERHSHPDGDYFTDDNSATTGFRYAYPLPSADASWKNTTTLSDPTLTCIAPVATVKFDLKLFDFPSHAVLRVMHGDTGIGFVMSNTSIRRFNNPCVACWESKMGCDGMVPKCSTCYESDRECVDLKVFGNQTFVVARPRGEIVSTRSFRDCKLLALSEAEIQDVPHAEDHPQLTCYYSALHPNLGQSAPPTGFKDRTFVNVMWIEEKDGVAYREGLGMVSKRLWNEVGAVLEKVRLG